MKKDNLRVYDFVLFIQVCVLQICQEHEVSLLNKSNPFGVFECQLRSEESQPPWCSQTSVDIHVKYFFASFRLTSFLC